MLAAYSAGAPSGYDIKAPRAAERVFGEHALGLHAAGLAVLPAAGKSPLRSGFNRWTRPPGRAVVARWRLQCPEADILYVTGLSRARPGGPGLAVLDGDDAEACHRIEELFGATPGRVRTRRGKHFLFLDPGGLGKVSSLRAFGINADMSTAPPSSWRPRAATPRTARSRIRLRPHRYPPSSDARHVRCTT